MGTGSKIALGCGCVLLAGMVMAAATCSLLAYWAKGKADGVVSDFDQIAKRAEAVTGEIDRWEREANSHPYAPAADGVIAEARLLWFLEVRKQVYAVYEARKDEIGPAERTAEAPAGKAAPSDLWTAGGRLAEVLGALRLAQAKALAEQGMSTTEYRDIQLAVYKTAWASDSERKTGQTPAEAIEKSMAEAGRQVSDAVSRGVAEAQRQKLPGAEHVSPEEAARIGAGLAEAGKAAKALEVPKANVELFRKHEVEIRKYAMSGLALLGL